MPGGVAGARLTAAPYADQLFNLVTAPNYDKYYWR
jgi:hypothetical protein